MEHTKQTVLCSHGDTWLGVYAARALLRAGTFHEVYAGVSDPTNELARSLEREGVKLCRWDLCDVKSIQSALEGVHSVLLFPFPSTDMVKLNNNLTTAIVESRIHHCLMWSYASLYSEGNFPAQCGCPHLEKGRKLVQSAKECEEMFLESGIHNKCIIRVLFPLQYFFFFSDIIQIKGVVPLAVGQGRFAPVHMKDVGQASANVLGKNISHEHHSQIYTCTGPQLVTGEELVKQANKSLNGTLTYKDCSMQEMKGILDKLVEEKEMSRFEGDLLLYINYLIRENLLSIQTDDMKKLLEGEPASIEAFFEENKSAFRPGLSRFFNRWVLNV